MSAQVNRLRNDRDADIAGKDHNHNTASRSNKEATDRTSAIDVRVGQVHHAVETVLDQRAHRRDVLARRLDQLAVRGQHRHLAEWQ